MKGNRQGSLSRSIIRRSDQNRKIKCSFFILRFCRQLVEKVRTDLFDKLKPGAPAPGFAAVQGEGGVSVRDPIWERRDPSSPAAPQQERE